MIKEVQKLLELFPVTNMEKKFKTSCVETLSKINESNYDSILNLLSTYLMMSSCSKPKQIEIETLIDKIRESYTNPNKVEVVTEEKKEDAKEVKPQLVSEDEFIEVAPPFGISKLQKYDVIKTNLVNYGTNRIPHYAVVYKVVDDLVYCVTLTSKETYGKMKVTKSRVFKNISYFVPCFSVVPHKAAVKKFAFVYDKPREFDKVIEEIKLLL